MLPGQVNYLLKPILPVTDVINNNLGALFSRMLFPDAFDKIPFRVCDSPKVSAQGSP